MWCFATCPPGLQHAEEVETKIMHERPSEKLNNKRDDIMFHNLQIVSMSLREAFLMQQLQAEPQADAWRIFVWAYMDHLRTVLGSILAASWFRLACILGTSWFHHGCMLGAAGCIFGASWLHLGSILGSS